MRIYLLGVASVIAVALFSGACTKSPNIVAFATTSTSSPTPTPSVSGTPVALALNLKAKLSGASTNYYSSYAVVPASAAVNTLVTKVFSDIPDTDLYYSDLSFVITADPSVCAAVYFKPYYYVRSQSATFLDPTSNSIATIDCSQAALALSPSSTAVKACYGGAATSLISTFPSYGTLDFLPGVTSSQTFSLPAAITGYNYSSNAAWSADNNSTPATAVTRSYQMQYAGSSLIQHYSIECVDANSNLLYAISFNIAPQRTVNGATQTYFYDWGD